MEEVIRDDPNYNFSFTNVDLVRPPIMRIDDGSFGYVPNKMLLENACFSLTMDSKIALLGSNGVGKTTLLKLLTEELKLSSGNYERNSKARIAMFN